MQLAAEEDVAVAREQQSLAVKESEISLVGVVSKGLPRSSITRLADRL